VKKVIIAILLFSIVACAYGSQRDPAAEAEALFKRGEYSKGLGLLNQALRGRALNPLARARALKTRAQFYEELMGNPDGALRQYKDILRMDLTADHPIKTLARERISTIESWKEQYRKEDAVLKRMRFIADTPQSRIKVKGQVTELQTLIRERPEYYRLVEAHFCLAKSYMALQKYAKARRLFEKCKQLKPCIDSYLPVTVQSKKAHRLWLEATIDKVSWWTPALLFILALIVFYASRPWRWIKLRHLIVGLAIMLLWLVVFYGTSVWLGKRFVANDTIIREINIQFPSFVSAAPASPGSQVVTYLFLYGLAGVLGTFVFATSTSRLKGRWASLLLNTAFALLLLASLSTFFYMRHCHHRSRFNSPTKSRLYYPKGHLYFTLPEPEVYILTNPKGYPNLQTRTIKDPEFLEWVLQHCSFDNSKQQADRPGGR
jgi:hypothetical protein